MLRLKEETLNETETRNYLPKVVRSFMNAEMEQVFLSPKMQALFEKGDPEDILKKYLFTSSQALHCEDGGMVLDVDKIIIYRGTWKNTDFDKAVSRGVKIYVGGLKDAFMKKLVKQTIGFVPQFFPVIYPTLYGCTVTPEVCACRTISTRLNLKAGAVIGNEIDSNCTLNFLTEPEKIIAAPGGFTVKPFSNKVVYRGNTIPIRTTVDSIKYLVNWAKKFEAIAALKKELGANFDDFETVMTWGHEKLENTFFNWSFVKTKPPYQVNCSSECLEVLPTIKRLWAYYPMQTEEDWGQYGGRCAFELPSGNFFVFAVQED